MNISRCLIIRPDALGDFISIIPVIRTLKKNYPQATITVLGSSANKEIASYIEELDFFIDKNDFEDKYWQLVKNIKQKKYELALVFNHAPKWAWLPMLAGIPNRIGDKYRIGISFLFNKGVYINNTDHSKHVFEYNLQYLKCLGIADKDMHRNITIDTSKFKHKFNNIYKKTIDSTQNNLESNHSRFPIHNSPNYAEKHFAKSNDYLVLHVGYLNGTRGRKWTTQAYISLIDKIHEHQQIQIILTGQKEFTSFTNEVVSKVKYPKLIVNLIEKTSIVDLIAILKNAKAYIGASTGITHLAAVCSVPVLMIKIIKAEKPIRWYPYGVPHDVVGTEKLICPYVCHAWKCTHDNCFREVNYSEVADRLFKLIEEEYDQDKSFRNTLSVAVFYNSTKKNLKNKVRTVLSEQGIRVNDCNFFNIFHIFKIWKFCITHDVTVMQPLNLKEYLFAKILSQFLPIALFVKPLVVHPKYINQLLNDPLKFYRNKFDDLSLKANKKIWKK